MKRVSLFVASMLGIAWLPGLTAAEPLAPSDSSRSEPSARPTPVVASGYVELAYALTSGPRDRNNVARGYIPREAEFMLSAASVKLERALPEQRTGTGFVIEAMAGDQASALRASGFDLGPDADLVQAYGVLGFPRAGLTVSLGKMATMLGIEVIESPANPNRSVGYSYLVLENFTDLGVDVAWAGRAGWSARARVVNGWDVVVDPNSSRSLFAKLGWSGGSHMIALLGYAGSELPDSIGGHRSGLELLASTRLGPASATLQLDAGRESALHATWQAATLWCSVPLREGLDLRLRAEVLDDRGGSRTSGVLGFPTHSGQSLAAFTAGLDFSGLSGALLRPEIRYDRSSIAAFAGAPDQWTMALTATLLY